MASDDLRKEILAKIRAYYQKVHAAPVPSGDLARIPYAGRVFDEHEMVNLVDAALDFWLTAGRYAKSFESGLAKFLGLRHALFVNSGSSANLLAFMALTSPRWGERQVKRGDEVITVAAGFPTTITPLLQYGAVPVFLDVVLETANVDIRLLEEALSPRTRAVILAHTLGNPFALGPVKEFCDRHNLWLIEDNCDALGARYFSGGQWRFTGTVGHLGTSSFYPPHHMTTGEGGAVYTDDPQLKKEVESLRDWGRDCWCASGKDNTCGRRFEWSLGELPPGYDHKYIYSRFGYNLKATDLQAAVGCAQLEKLPGFIEARRRHWRYLREGMAGLESIFHFPEPTPQAEPSWFGFLLTLRKDSGRRREDIIAHLESKGIQTRMLFAGNILRHPCFDELKKSKEGWRVVGELKNTDEIMNQSFWVGVYPGLTDNMLSRMVEEIRTAVR